MKRQSADPKVTKIVAIPVRQNIALEEIAHHFRISQSEAIRRGIELAIKEYAFVLTDCEGIILENEVAKRCA